MEECKKTITSSCANNTESLLLKEQFTNVIKVFAMISKLHEEQKFKDRILSSLLEERNKLLQDIPQEGIHCPVDVTLPHYHYILPLVKEIHLLELRLKEQQKKYDKLKLQCEAASLGHAVLVDSFNEVECVLKRWSQELREISCKAARDKEEKSESVTNITYHAETDQQVLIEELGFTVLCQGVHVGVVIKSQITYPNIHLPLSPTSARIGINSDTFIPTLDEKVMTAISQGGHVTEVVSLVSHYIQDDMAPYVIIIPLKKKVGKQKATKSKGLKTSSANPKSNTTG